MSSIEVAIAFGYLTQNELKALKELASLVGENATIVNVGSGSGTSGLCFGEIRPHARRYTVDISAGGPFGGMENERNAYEGTGVPLPIQLLGDSHKIGKNWKGSLIDLLFIDADHLCDGILGDMDAWLPHMNDKGIVAFHDYGSNNWPCVKTTVDTVMDKQEIISRVDSLIGFRYERL